MSVGMVGFVTDVVVGVAVVGAGSAASCVGDVGQRHGKMCTVVMELKLLDLAPLLQ